MSDVLPIPQWNTEVKPSSKTTLIVVDMQKLFMTEKKSPWADRKLLSIVPNIEKLIKIIGVENLIFTKFVPPKKWQDARRSWRTYYQINKKITANVIGTRAFDIIDNFLPYIPISTISSRKKSASIFTNRDFHSKIKKRSIKFLIFTGIETDYCVLSSVLEAIHLGYYVIVVLDACSSSKKDGQKNAKGIFKRFPEQLWVTTTKDLIKQFQISKNFSNK